MRTVYVFDQRNDLVEEWGRKHFFNVRWISSREENIHEAFSVCRPDIIITTRPEDRRHPVLMGMPRYIRQRWIHSDHMAGITPEVIATCHKKMIGLNLSPVLTVFTTTYRSGQKILRPFQSLLEQTCREWEWVIVDDSPDDETWDMLKTLASTDCRIRLYRNLHHRGDIGAVKRDAAMLGYGAYLVELDHDDEFLPDALEIIRQVFDKADPDVAMVSSDFVEMYEGTSDSHCYGSYFGMNFGAYYKERLRGEWVNVCRTPPVNAYTIRHIVSVPNHVRAWRASAYRKLGGHDANLNVADDYDLIVRTFLEYRMIRIPKLLYIQYRNRGGDNFTFHRNGLIQELVRYLACRYDDQINTRLIRLGHPDPVYPLLEKSVHAPPLPYLSWRPDPLAIDRMMEPHTAYRVSIIMTCLSNDKEGVMRSISSVIRQSYRDWILYIIGDQRPELDTIMHDIFDERVRYWNLTDTGTGGLDEGTRARNYALRMLVSTDWITYIDEGCAWDQRHLQNMFHHAQKNRCNFFRDADHLLHKFSLLEEHGYWKRTSETGIPSIDELVSRWSVNRVKDASENHEAGYLQDNVIILS